MCCSVKNWTRNWLRSFNWTRAELSSEVLTNHLPVSSLLQELWLWRFVSYMYIQTTNTQHKQRTVKEVSFLKLSGCWVCTESHVHTSLSLNIAELDSLTNKNANFSPSDPIMYLSPQHVAILYKTFWYLVELHENIRKQIQQKHKNPLNLQSNISTEEVLGEVHWIICPPPPVNMGIMMEDGMAACIRGYTSARGGPGRAGRSEMDDVIWAQNLRWDLCFTMYLLNKKRKERWVLCKLKHISVQLQSTKTDGCTWTCTRIKTDLSRVSQKRRKTGRSRWRLWRLSSRTVTSHFCTLGSVFASSYFRWKARTGGEACTELRVEGNKVPSLLGHLYLKFTHN